MYRFINQYAKRVSTICQQVYKYDHITCHNKQISASTSVFTIETNDSLDFAQHVYRKQPFLDSTLDVEEKILLDNGHKCTPVFATSQLNRLPVEVLIEILLQSVIPSLTTSATSTAAQCRLSTQSASTLQSSSIALTSSAPLSASRQTPLTVLRYTVRNTMYNPMFHLQSLWRSSLSDRLLQHLLLLFHYSPLTNQET